MKLFFPINKALTVFLIFFISMINQSYSQNFKSDFWEHVRYGGGIGLNFGDEFFSGTLAPNAVYEFNKSFSLGLGINGTYNSQKNIYKSTILGGSLIGYYNPINEIQISAEFEELNVNRRYNVNLNRPNENYWIPALYFGAGYRNGNVTFGIRYDVLYDTDKSIYSQAWAPFVRFYF
ncbi:alpha-ketoglutarate decarboxylase [Algibacter sp. L4_22]|uniref:alpha-ketoglutarate decarboxylase n=1 Tax=Algibacter sp. L4_22 TaxID=2942477 RepID=UPI00201B51E7|nr:alpha-ketoglutarate decarboxylase [Algibacter sp. L4_22]MCL5127527.1 alpha-ketoglutarate decarboxylase [Algibacter sp. L4_22]